MEPTTGEKNRFVRTVDEFMENYTFLLSRETQNKVYGMGDPALNAEYENMINNAGRLRGVILTTVGAWEQARAALTSVTDVTSMYIGDAIDEIRSWFGYDPTRGLNGLGVFQLPAAAWMIGIISAAVLLNSAMSKLFIKIETASLVRSGVNPGEALRIASNALAPSLLGGVNKTLLIGGALALFLLMRA